MSLTLSAELPKGYESRTMWLYVAKTTKTRWGLWFSDGRGYSVPARTDHPTWTHKARQQFTTRRAAVEFCKAQGWTPYPGIGRSSVPNRLWIAKGHMADVTSLVVHSRTHQEQC